MIRQTTTKWQPFEWQDHLKEAETCPESLCHRLGLNPKDILLNSNFKLQVPLPFIRRMEKGNPKDPLLLQVLPDKREELITDGYLHSPIEEEKYNPLPGVLHKYKNRILLTITKACPIHCRYCFRRHFPYDDNRFSLTQMSKAISYIEENPDIDEVILSGGDPLTVNDVHLSKLIKMLNKVSQLKRIRIHTRFIVTIPQRVTSSLLLILRTSEIPIVIVTHINHAQEIDEDLTYAIKALKDTSTPILNQSVLLKNINDNADTLEKLSDQLFQIGVFPYYLHLLDKVQGSAHFDVERERAIAIYQELQKNLSGYLVPKLVEEIPGAVSKMNVV